MKRLSILIIIMMVAGCSNSLGIPDTDETPKLMQRGSTYNDLTKLPDPRGKMYVSIYDFRDQTGQYKPQPNSNFSTAVPQGAISLLIMSLIDSKWFVPLEREGLQNLLTERKIIRAAQNGSKSESSIPSLRSANVMIEGGIVAYDTNIKTGGLGARYLGIGASSQYRTDQVTVSLRVVDVATGAILSSVTTSKTIFSQEMQGGAFRYIDYKDLLEVELGYTNNEPVNIALMSAIDAAVIYLVVQGIDQGLWQPKSAEELNNAIYKNYSKHTVEVL
ncbi:CsgG/HfaB family protein [Vibrio rumoiensis]|uniref:Curli production assembly/transport component CsgG n=1 Tax=Vibrio rumoiensis 1S-45 TaxID=1188252 RepID=A0A1E5DZ46_9VIBR|nr:CsgG/HfaB family protein [Vibrio rumoiensis]OEF23159.1 curli production assembly/transport protein CsgG [Vibrio rumoiensis 1S-45]